MHASLLLLIVYFNYSFAFFILRPEPDAVPDLDCYVTLLEIVYFMCNESKIMHLLRTVVSVLSKLFFDLLFT